jgi:hypothetical protein
VDRNKILKIGSTGIKGIGIGPNAFAIFYCAAVFYFGAVMEICTWKPT